MAYTDFPNDLKGQKERKAFWLSEDGLALIGGWRRQGMPLTKIATECIGISKTAFWGWYRESDELRSVCAKSLEVTNSSVEESLLKKALGYYYNEDVLELVEGVLTLTRRTVKHVPPDTRAILTWLFNRLPERWRSVQEPLEATQYTNTVKNILVAMKEVAEGSGDKQVEVAEAVPENQ